MTKENSTFKINYSDIYFNACVGRNGFNDIRTYEDGYNTAVQKLIDAAKNDIRISVDTIIYPIVFSARHRIELFLKRTAHHLLEMNKMINNKIESEGFEFTHDLNILWSNVKRFAEIDIRNADWVMDLNLYIIDYFDVDLTGEAFRYPFNKDEKRHLDDISCINILNFEDKYLKMSNIMEDVNYLIEFLFEEYSQGTYVSGLSRKIIEDISIELPDATTWNNVEFDEIRKNIIVKYNISYNKLSKAINLIKKHRQFSSNIGLIIPVKELNVSEFAYYKERYNAFHSKKHEDYYIEKERFEKDLKQNISKDAITALVVFKEMGRFNYYSEQYDLQFKFFTEKNDNGIAFFNLIDGKKILIWIEAGMKICGQYQFA